MSASRPRQHRPTMSEDDFLERVLDAAGLLGWHIVHIRPAMIRSGRWVTPYRGHPGLPDLIMAKNGRVVLAELKSATGKPTAEQLGWLAAAGPNGYLWSPKDWPEVEAVLRGRERESDLRAAGVP